MNRNRWGGKITEMVRALKNEPEMTEEIFAKVQETIEMMRAGENETPLLREAARERLLSHDDDPFFIERREGGVIICTQRFEVYYSSYGMSVDEGPVERFVAIGRLFYDEGAYNRDFRVWRSLPPVAHTKRFPWFEKKDEDG